MSKTQGNIKPLFDYVLVKPVKSEEILPSGIVLPDSAKEKPQVGEIMAIGPGAHNEEGKLIPMIVKVGQKVLYKKWGGNEVKVGHEEWLLIEQKDVMAVVL
ncbi:co-chaperone GroES [bacterium]|nr:MAG: co-chaperone GroES [bacterium]